MKRDTLCNILNEYNKPLSILTMYCYLFSCTKCLSFMWIETSNAASCTSIRQWSIFFVKLSKLLGEKKRADVYLKRFPIRIHYRKCTKCNAMLASLSGHTVDKTSVVTKGPNNPLPKFLWYAALKCFLTLYVLVISKILNKHRHFILLEVREQLG